MKRIARWITAGGLGLLALATTPSLGLANPMCWYCTLGKCSLEEGSWGHIGAEGCYMNGSQCVLTGSWCPFTFATPEGVDAAGAVVESCRNDVVGWSNTGAAQLATPQQVEIVI